MCVDWIAYILLYVNWIDNWKWVLMNCIEIGWIICYCWEMVNWKWILIMCLLCELLLRNDELEVNMMSCLRLNDLLTIDWFVFVVDNDVNVEYVELRYEILNYVDDERMIWAIEIVDLKFVELDWIDELCELFVFDGNELVV